MNSSQKNSHRKWIGWISNGSVNMTRPQFSAGALVVSATATHHGGLAKGFTTVSLGNVVVNSGEGWSVSEPLYCMVVPSHREFRLGEVLERLPGNSMPVEFFFH